MARRRRELPDPVETTQESLNVLAAYRRRGERKSEEVVKRGEKILQEKGALRRMGDEVWPFLEQLGFAALDTGKIELASICVQRLEEKFPKSPRVDALYGLLLEVDSKEKARDFYLKRLSEDENNVLVRKRLIALHLHSNNITTSENATPGKGPTNLSIQKGIALLAEHLDTVYNDPEGWSELADAYEKLGMYSQTLSCLGDLLILQPTNTFHVLRHAETAYTIGDYQLAYREFCRALEMAGPMIEGGLGRRAAFGIKLCLQRLGCLDESVTGKKGKRTQQQFEANGSVAPPKKAQDIDALITNELLIAYGKPWENLGDRVAGHEENKLVKAWLSK